MSAQASKASLKYRHHDECGTRKGTLLTRSAGLVDVSILPMPTSPLAERLFVTGVSRRKGWPLFFCVIYTINDERSGTFRTSGWKIFRSSRSYDLAQFQLGGSG